MKTCIALTVLVFAPAAYAQGLKLDVFDRLKDKASEVVDIDLPKDLLGLSGVLLPNDKTDAHPDAAKMKKLAAGLNNVLVKSLEFAKEGAYTDADVRQLISQLDGPGWKLVVSADEKKEKSRIWMKSAGEGEIGGLRVMSAEQKELTVVEITGRISLEDLKDLAGLGIPNFKFGSEHIGPPSKKDEE